MEMFAMKWWMLVVVVSAEMFCAEAEQYYIRNLADDSFNVTVSANDPRVVITLLPCYNEQPEILGCIEQPYGRGSTRREKRYNVVFEDGYVPPKGNEPFIFFRNERGGFRLVFPTEGYAELRSDMASEIHDDPKRREYDCNHPYIRGKSYRDEYDGFMRHWVVFDQYVAACCYERYNFPMRCIDILEALDDNSWISSIKEVDFDLYVGINTPCRYPPPQWSKHHWWRSLCCCTNCD
jgi:hypothetical protein